MLPIDSLTTEILTAERTDSIVRLTLNRPEKRNALSVEMIAGLDAAFTALADDKSAHVIILASKGTVFSSGHDLKEMHGRTEEEYAQIFSNCSRMMQRIQQLPQPVIAQVQGMATAAGCQLVAACDLAVASRNASFATPGVRIGLFCSTPMVPLMRSVPTKVAMEMLLTGQPISAERAANVGLINQVVDPMDLEMVTLDLARSITQASAATIGLGKAAFYRQYAMTSTAAYSDANATMTQNALIHDAQEGIGAFLQKRAPNWKHQ